MSNFWLRFSEQVPQVKHFGFHSEYNRQQKYHRKSQGRVYSQLKVSKMAQRKIHFNQPDSGITHLTCKISHSIREGGSVWERDTLRTVDPQPRHRWKSSAQIERSTMFLSPECNILERTFIYTLSKMSVMWVKMATSNVCNVFKGCSRKPILQYSKV